jgi:hypothetical protein
VGALFVLFFGSGLSLTHPFVQPMFDRLSLPESKDLDDDFERMCVEKKAVIFDYVKKNVGNAKL